MNSALISARLIRHIEMNWAWASGGQAGLILDVWNIRLVPAPVRWFHNWLSRLHLEQIRMDRVGGVV
jgi:hypothetical protein